ncbi:MAG: 2-amino-4-hydroxy-6-hydroxymethyldihydropteridine diphosphokinase [Candidatus Puniceispirillaceae bacterium]
MLTRVFLGIGGNLVPEGYSSVRAGCGAAVAQLAARGFSDLETSPWYETAPVPVSDQPWYVNAVIAATTSMPPDVALAAIHAVEADFGRVRGVRNAARVLDIDLLDYGGMVLQSDEITLPHPRMHQRAFVLLPLRDLAPDWVHPVLQQELPPLIAALPPNQEIRRAD